MVATALALTMALLLMAEVLFGRSTEPAGRTVVPVRLWDEQVAAAYRESFDEFTRIHPDIDVRVNVVAYATYFDTFAPTPRAAARMTSSGCRTRTSPDTPTAAG